MKKYNIDTNGECTVILNYLYTQYEVDLLDYGDENTSAATVYINDTLVSGSTYYYTINFNNSQNEFIKTINVINTSGDTQTISISPRFNNLVDLRLFSTVSEEEKDANKDIGNAIQFITLTQAEYDALSERNPNTAYCITDAGGGGGGTTNYNQLSNKPSINGVTLEGNKTSEDLHIQGGSGTTDYTQLNNKPSINGVELNGNKTTANLQISYNDLTNKPTIPAAQVNSDWNSTSGVSRILNKPTIPTKTTDLTNDSKFVDSTSTTAVTHLWVGTQSEYDAITTKNNNTIYFIK